MQQKQVEQRTQGRNMTGVIENQQGGQYDKSRVSKKGDQEMKSDI